MPSISTACLAWIRKQGHFTAGQLQNPWQMLAEPRLKITGVDWNGKQFKEGTNAMH